VQETYIKMTERTKNGLKTVHMKCKSGEIFL